MYKQLSVQGLGACLTQANLEDIKRFIEDFAVRALLPAMEARVRALNHQVNKLLPNLFACIAAHVCDLLPQECRRMELYRYFDVTKTKKEKCCTVCHTSFFLMTILLMDYCQTRLHRILLSVNISASSDSAGQVNQEGLDKSAQDAAVEKALHRVSIFHAWQRLPAVWVHPRGFSAWWRCKWRPDCLLWRFHRVPDALAGRPCIPHAGATNFRTSFLCGPHARQSPRDFCHAIFPAFLI